MCICAPQLRENTIQVSSASRGIDLYRTAIDAGAFELARFRLLLPLDLDLVNNLIRLLV